MSSVTSRLCLLLAIGLAACGDDAKKAADASDTVADAADTTDAAGDSVSTETTEPTDTTEPVDTAADTADTTADTTEDTTETETTPTCGDLAALLADDDIALMGGSGYPLFFFGTGGDLGFGGPGMDQILLGFFGLELGENELVGTFVYGVDLNADVATASELFLVLEDDGAKSYFARAGTVTTDAPPGLAQGWSAYIADLEIEEVLIDEETGESTPVEGGACYRLDEIVLTEPCTPVCGSNVCGPDGCGGECPGVTCEAVVDVCLLDGTGCAPAAECETITLPSLLAHDVDGSLRNAYTLGLGRVTGADGLDLRVDPASAETIALDLAAGDNASPATCKQCVRLDVDGELTFFQSAGTMIVNPPSELDEDPDDDVADVTLIGVRLQQVTIDADGIATPVHEGRCIALADVRLSTRIDTPPLYEYEGWYVSPETPIVSPDGTMVTGGFQFIRVSGPDTRGGGACLLADVDDEMPCTTSDDCPALDPAEVGSLYYCEPLGIDGPKRCWFRPSDNCVRSPTRAPGYYTTLPEPSLLDEDTTIWATIVCMSDPSTGTGCAGGLHRYFISPTKTVDPPAPP